MNHRWTPLAAAALVAGGVPFLAALGDKQTEAPKPMDRIAERYVKLVLGMEAHDAGYVDAYYGPPEWRKEVEAHKRPLSELRGEAERLIGDVDRLAPPSGDETASLRHGYLRRQLQALVGRTRLLSGEKLSFDQESEALYDAVAPTQGEDEFKGTLLELEKALPGEGPLAARYEAFKQRFLVPKEKLDAVFKAAIDEARRRTRAHIDLPPDESFVVEYVTNQPWSGYNWYKGGYHSLIQVNTDLPISIDRAVDLACHEGYPGHHVYNVLLEKHLVRERGFVEFTVYPLYSPQSLIAEGTANYGIEVALPGAERAAWEKQALFPLAGLDASQAERYYAVQALIERLSYAGNEAARRYLEGRIDAAAAASWLETYALMAPARAQQRVKFFDRYRSYVINYNLGKDLVTRYIEARGGTPDQPQKRWDEFKRLLASPRLPGGLK